MGRGRERLPSPGAVSGHRSWRQYEYTILYHPRPVAGHLVLGPPPLRLRRTLWSGRGSADPDADGLVNRLEYNNTAAGSGYLEVDGRTGTHPQLNDTDDDGLSDGAELLVWLTDPSWNDTDFDGMPEESTLTELSERMLARRPAAVKIVPTAATLADSASILRWVEGASGDVERIGFVMGAVGACSRILTIAFGAPITYASFGAPVAPGQVAIDDLLDVYRAMDLDRDTRVVAVLDGSVVAINRQFRDESSNKVAIGFAPQYLDELTALRDALHIDDIRV